MVSSIFTPGFNPRFTPDGFAIPAPKLKVKDSTEQVVHPDITQTDDMLYSPCVSMDISTAKNKNIKAKKFLSYTLYQKLVLSLG